MSRPSRLVVAVLTAGLAAAPAAADSLYSLRGNGEPVLPVRADARAMGGAEAASSSPSVSGNPASMVFADQTTFYGSFLFEWLRVEEPTDSGKLVSKDYSAYIPNLALIFPLPGEFRLGTGFLVDRRRSGRVVFPNATSDGTPYEQIFEASGNLLVFPALAARRVRGVDLGAGVDLQLVNSKLRWRNEFADGLGFVSSDDLVRTTLWGASWKAGAIVPVGSALSLGGWYSSSSDLSGRRKLERDDGVTDLDDEEFDAAGAIPAKWSTGLELRLLRGLRGTFDFVREEWEGHEREGEDETFVNVNRWAGGVEWTPPAGKDGFRYPIRLGYRTQELHTLDARGNRVREHVFSGGSGFGLAGGRGSIDWYLEYGWRGEVDVTEYYEQFVRIGLTLTGTEEWSGRRRPEDEEDW